jgi:hypothetical protein
VSASPGDRSSGRPGPGPRAPLTPGELEARLRGPGEPSEAELLDMLNALDRRHLDPADDDPVWAGPDGDDLAWAGPAGEGPDGGPGAGLFGGVPDDDPCGGGPDGEEGDLDGYAEPGGPSFPGLIGAGFIHRYPAGGATGFRAGGPLDAMLPGADLAWHLAAARQRGLGALSDDELCGLIAASRRAESWQAELGLAAVSELDARRAGPDGREGEHVDDELAALLTLTGRSAQAQLELARQLDRLPCTRALLAAGIIDRPRACVITGHLSLLPDAEAAAVDAPVAAKAGAADHRAAGPGLPPHGSGP